jgi:ketosteroid isomerase-like protein
VEPAKVVEELWARFQARDWTGAAELVAEDVVVDWPVSSERIAGRANFIGVNQQYPEGWSIRVLRIIASGDQVAAEVEVPHQDMGVFRAASFWTVAGGQLRRGTEYWTSLGADESPAWRAQFVERTSE